MAPGYETNRSGPQKRTRTASKCIKSCGHDPHRTMMLSRSVMGHYRQRFSLLTSNTARFYSDQRLTGLWNAPLAASRSEEDDDLRASPLFQHQVRWKRKGGASAFSKPRPPTRKQRKAYNRRKAKLYHEREGKHSAPGSKAGYRRQFNEDTFQELLDSNKKDPGFDQQLLEYDYGDALVDDLMGNTSSITSIPTPTPRYLGNKHKKFYNRVQRKMDVYREAVLRLEDGTEKEETSGDEPALPSDHEISLVMRAYRDRRGTKTRPIGIAKALKHLLTDLSLPTASFGEETYTTLLTCCRTPTEARRILRLMKEQQHAISAYSWAILVDVHAKLGDFEGADAVMGEMVTEGVSPSLAAYTSLFAACYKVCNNGTIPHEVRDKAGKLGWSRWKEMRVMGLDPDVMAYGALLRLVAARGQPERAINILEEMQTMEVKPTTLCFTSALKAVSRSQQTAIRFERGSSKKNKRREQITAHHGKLARNIVIMAENAEVEQDDGFVAALMLCAGAAGDSATAKAILLASEVRRMDHLRSIGSNEHLRRLQGESVPSDRPLAMTGGQPSLYLPNGKTESDIDTGVTSTDIVARNGERAVSHSPKQKKIYPSFEEREYGKDTRKLSALLFACSQAVESHGLGTQWAGRDSKGYLCANSLRLLTLRPQPKYYYPAIPGVSSTEVAMGSIDWKDENPEHLSKSLRRAKYMGINQDDSVGYTMDDISEEFYDMFKDEYEQAQNKKSSYMFRGEKADNKDDYIDPRLLDKKQWEKVKQSKAAVAVRGRKQREFEKQESSIEEALYKESDEEWYFDDDVMRWKTRKRQGHNFAASSSVESNFDKGESESEEDNEMFFDDNIMRWSTRPKKTEQTTYAGDSPSGVDKGDTIENISQGSDEEFQKFYQDMKQQIKEIGDDVDFTEEEAREMFAITEEQDIAGGDFVHDEDAPDDNEYEDFIPPADFETFYAEIREEWDVTESEARELYDSMDKQGRDDYRDATTNETTNDQPDEEHGIAVSHPVFANRKQESQMAHAVETSIDIWEDERSVKLATLQQALPGLPRKRAMKVVQVFGKSLGYPSMLELVPILRENMPDYLTSGWLKRRNISNAEAVLEQAREEDSMDIHVLNGALQVKTSAGSLDDAIAYHEDAFDKHGVAPVVYSDRLVLQMLVRNNRLPRALAFKQKIEEDGRNLDVISYGSLIEYYGNHGQLGSAMMVLKECLAIHGSPPGAKSLSKLRLLCRQHDMEKKLKLEELIGKDPMDWLRHGEAHLKREMSRKGRRDLNLARNRLLQA